MNRGMTSKDVIEVNGLKVLMEVGCLAVCGQDCLIAQLQLYYRKELSGALIMRK